MAIDHDLVSFVDVALDQWPVVVVTNPKDARFMVPRTEPIGRIKHSTHIRQVGVSWSVTGLPVVCVCGGHGVGAGGLGVLWCLARPCRMLIFSPSPVTAVTVFIDGKALASKAENIGGPLYVLPWRPEDLSGGKHGILVSAEVCCVLHSTSAHGGVHRYGVCVCLCV